jgi:hypothetical protein
MAFELKIETDNAAFSEDPGAEIARILRDVARVVAQGGLEGFVADSNGNMVGNFELTTTGD